MIQVKNTAFLYAKKSDFENWPLDGGPVGSPLYTGWTVLKKMCKIHSRLGQKQQNHNTKRVTDMVAEQFA